MSVLHVAQKNSIAKQVAGVLSNFKKRTRATLSKFNPVYEFQLSNITMTFTSVRGHIFDYQLPEQCKNWNTYDNKRILSTNQVPLKKILGHDMNDVVKNLQRLAQECKQLVLWLDCDREGEAIAFQVIDVCTRVNRRLKIQRAKFAAVTSTDVWNAYHNLIQPNKREADAVNFRIQIDFRLGCTFTRYQTTLFQKYYQLISKTVLSYGPCQMPTLSFVVNRYLQIKYFKPEKYWVIQATCVIDQNTGIPFTWARKNTRDENLANSLVFEIIDQFQDGEVYGTVKERKMNPKKRYRPYPLTTVAFQKLATDKLKMTSAKAMEVAEKLYQRGLISYPRTQTNAFPKTMNLKELIGRLQNSDTYHSYIDKLLNNNKYVNPKVGSGNDQAHTPIHPVKLVQLSDLTQEERKVYDLICRHFLACCSKDATGEQFQVKADIGGEEFKASYLSIKEKNYLQIYPYDKWTESSFPAQIPEKFPVLLDLREAKTTPPNYLTESQLIDMMQKNQIGTDSTIHEHIETIQKRQYAIKTNNTFKPTNLGASLIQTYRKLDITLPECQIRRKIEQFMNRIASGQINITEATAETLFNMEPLYDKLQEKKNQWMNTLKQCMEEFKDLKNVGIQQKQQNTSPYRNPIEACRCPICKQIAYVRYSQKTSAYFVGCSKYPICKWIQSLPAYIQQIQRGSSTCFKCGAQQIKIKAKQNASINQIIMKIRFLESSNNQTLELCLNPGCDQDFYENIEEQMGHKNISPIANSNRNNSQTNSFSRTNTINTVTHQFTRPKNLQKKQIVCYACKQIGHLSTNCSNFKKGKISETTGNYRNNDKKGPVSTNYTNNNIICFKCKQPGHIAPNCQNQGKEFKKKYHKNNAEKNNKPKKICPQCKCEGRHPRNTTCSRVKRRGKSKDVGLSEQQQN